LRHGFLNEKKNCCIFLVNIIQTLFLKNFKNSGALVVPFVPFVPISADGRMLITGFIKLPNRLLPASSSVQFPRKFVCSQTINARVEIQNIR
jgi:hypothetical protein